LCDPVVVEFEPIQPQDCDQHTEDEAHYKNTVSNLPKHGLSFLIEKLMKWADHPAMRPDGGVFGRLLALSAGILASLPEDD
jgi:hypothetical protein